MKIETHRIKTSLGQLTPFGQSKLSFLTEDQIKEFDQIGYTGKNSKGEEESFESFLNRINPKEQFKVEKTKADRGDFIEEYMVTRVILD
jgi:hypothetical protein